MTRPAIPRAVALVAAVGFLALAGCDGRSGSSSSPGKSPNRMSAAELNAYAAVAGPTHAVNAIIAPPAQTTPPPKFSMRAGTKEIAIVAQAVPAPEAVAAPAPPKSKIAYTRPAPEPKAQPRPFTGIQLVKITGEPKGSREDAKADAVRKAKAELVRRLELLDPPVWMTPSLARVQNEYCPPNLIRVDMVADDPKWDELKKLNGKPELYVAEVSVELSDDQVRQLRQEERVQNGLIGVGGLAVGSLVVCGLLRAGTAAGRITRRIPGRFTLAQILFWSLAPLLALFILFRIR